MHLFIRICSGVASRLRNVWFRALGVRLTGYVWMRRISIPQNWSDVTIEAGAGLDDGVVLLCSGEPKQNKIIIRSGTYINRYAIIDAHRSIEIGPNVMIGPGCFITDADHGTAPDKLVGDQSMRIGPVLVEEGVWVGAHVTILKGVTISRGAIVGAGSVVTQNVDVNQIVAGVPARVIGTRAKMPRD
jgi:serine acetyltransferase